MVLASVRARPDPLWWSYLLLGCGTLFPWNAFITAADYWALRFPGKHVDRLLTISYLPVNLAVIAALVHWHAAVPPRLRVLSGLAGFTAAVSAVPLLDLAPPSAGALAAVLLLVAACGACDGVAQGALFGEAALLPQQYTQALVSGTAVSGVAVSLLRVVTKATLPDSEAGLRRSANCYFALAALVCAACTAVYAVVLPRLPAARRYRQAALDAAVHAGGDAAGGGAAQPGWKAWDGGQEAPQEAHQQAQQQRKQQPAGRPSSVEVELSYEDHHLQYLDGSSQQQEAATQALLPGPGPRGGLDSSSSDGDGGAWVHGRGAPPHLEGLAEEPQRGDALALPAGAAAARAGGGGSRLTGLAVFRSIWRLATANALIYVVTLSIFPGVLAEDVHSAELGSWYPVALLALFNLADCVGKNLPGLPALRLSDGRLILGLSASRALFVPAFHLAAVWGAGPGAMGALTLALGGSNGYMTACAMMAGAHQAPAAAAELAGNVMVLFLILGLCAGAACGFLWLL